MNRRLQLKTELLRLEGAGESQSEIVEALREKYRVSKRTIYYYFRTRHEWQPEIMGLDTAKQGYHQTLNRLEYIYRHFSLVFMQATENNNKIGALKGMLETTLKKAELTGVLVPSLSPDDPRSFQNLIDDEVMHTLTAEEEALVLQAASVFQKKRAKIMELRTRENTSEKMEMTVVGSE